MHWLAFNGLLNAQRRLTEPAEFLWRCWKWMEIHSTISQRFLIEITLSAVLTFKSKRMSGSYTRLKLSVKGTPTCNSRGICSRIGCMKLYLWNNNIKRIIEDLDFSFFFFLHHLSSLPKPLCVLGPINTMISLLED